MIDQDCPKSGREPFAARDKISFGRRGPVFTYFSTLQIPKRITCFYDPKCPKICPKEFFDPKYHQPIGQRPFFIFPFA